MKKLELTTVFLLGVLVLFYNCNSDNSTQSDDGPEEATLAGEFIERIENSNNELTYKIVSAFLTNNSIENLNISTSSSLLDDEFKFTVNNDAISLTWNKGYAVNLQADNVSNSVLDKLNPTFITVLDVVTDSVLSSLSSNTDMQVSINESFDLQVQLNFTNENSVLVIDLEQKTSSDYLSYSSISQPVEVFEFQSLGSFLDMQYSLAENSLFIYSRINQDEAKFIKYDINSGVDSYKSISGLNSFDKQFELVNGELFGISSHDLTILDYELATEPITFDCNICPDSWYTTASYNDEIFLIGGYGQLEANRISKFNTNTNSFEIFTSLPQELTRADGKIYDDKLYIFGGMYIDGNQNFYAYDAIFVYDVNDGTLLEELSLPTYVTETFVSRHQNLIFVAGRADDDGAENGISTYSYLGVFDTVNNSFQEIDISSHFPTDYYMRNMAVSGDKMYFLFAVPGYQGFKVFETNLLQ